MSLRVSPSERISSSRAYRPLPAEGAAPVYAHRLALPHLWGRDIVIDCRRTFGVRRFSSDLPPDFGLRAVLGRLPVSAREELP